MIKNCCQKILGLITMILCFACSSTRTTVPNEHLQTLACSQMAILEMAASENPACGLYFKLYSGKRIIPVEITDGNQTGMEVGQKYYLEYEPIPDIESDCSPEDIIARITCLKKFESGSGLLQFPHTASCEKIIDPYEIAWMNQCIIHYQPISISRYKMNKKKIEWAYAFTTRDSIIIYDCRAGLLCSCHRQNRNTCKETMKQVKDSTVILVINER